MGVPWKTRKYIRGSTMAKRLKNTGLKASHYFLHWSEATNLFKRPENQTMQYVTEILHDLRVFTVAALNNYIQPHGSCTPINKNTRYVSRIREIHISYTLPIKSAKHVLFFISEGSRDFLNSGFRQRLNVWRFLSIEIRHLQVFWIISLRSCIFSFSSGFSLFSCSIISFCVPFSLISRFCVILASLSSFSFIFMMACQSWLTIPPFGVDFFHAASFIKFVFFMRSITKYQ